MEKELPPTEKKLKKARTEGNILRGPVLGHAVTIGIATGSMVWMLQSRWVELQKYIEKGAIYSSGKEAELFAVWGEELVWIVLFPLLLGGGVTSLLQWIIAGFPIGRANPPDKLNIVKGLVKTFGNLKNLPLILGKGYGALGLGGGISILCIKNVILCSEAPESTRIRTCFQVLSSASFYGFLILLGWGAVEFFLNRRRYIKGVSMSREEAKEEHKEDEGDPQVKGERKYLHELLTYQQVVERVKRSKVVVVQRA